MTQRANIGCGSIVQPGWSNYDLCPADKATYWDVRTPLAARERDFEYAVCSFMLQELDHHEIPNALANMAMTIQPYGWLRILVPDITKPIAAYQAEDVAWFPQDERTPGLDMKFCSYITWYGTARSVFTSSYLYQQMRCTGMFRLVQKAAFGHTHSRTPEILQLDSRLSEALVMEGQVR